MRLAPGVASVEVPAICAAPASTPAAVQPPVASAPAPAAAAAALPVKAAAPEKSHGKREHQSPKHDAETEPISVASLVDLSKLPTPTEANSEMGQIYKKLQGWYVTNKARNMLPKSRYEPHELLRSISC